MSLRKLLAAVMVVSMVFGLVGTTVFAQAEAAALEAATGRLQGYGIVTGDPDGGLRLEATITRAELMAVLVRANMLDDVAALVAGTQPFSDVAPDAWYTGYVAIAKAKGWTTGYPDGTFQPGANVSNAEVLAFLARVAGLAPAAAAWPENYVKAAVDAGLIPAGLDVAALAGQPAIRGVVFALADAFFLKVRDANGKNLYQRFHDSTAPVVTLDAVAPQTTTTSVKASGKVEGAEAAFLNGNPLVLAADGAFSADIQLAIGKNDIVITAVDLVGNEGSASVSVLRINTAAAHIAAPASLSVAAGASGAAAVIVHDTNGAEIAGAVVTATVEPAELGSYDAATGTFTAGTKAGSGTLTLASGDVTATVAVTVTPAALAKIEVTPGNVAVSKGDIQQFTATGYDAFGNAITAVTPTWVVTNADGSATSKAFISSSGAFIGSDTGTYKVTATVDAFTASATAGIYGAATAIKLTGPATLVANDASEAKFEVTVVDANGNLAGGFSETLDIATTDATIGVDSTVDIKNGTGSFKVTASPDLAGLVVTLTVTGADLGPADEDGIDSAVDLVKATADVEMLEQVATGLKSTGASKYLAANTSDEEATAKFTVVDQDGKPMLDGSTYTLDLKVSGPATFDGGETTDEADYNGDGVDVSVTVFSSKGDTGTITVTASAEGLGSATATITAAIAGAPKLINVTSNVTEVIADDDPAVDATDKKHTAKVSVEVTDKNGIPTRITGQLGVTFAADKNKRFLTSLTESATAGVYELGFVDSATASFTFNAEVAGTVTVSVGTHKDLDWPVDTDDQDVALTKGSVAVKVNPDSPAAVKFKTSAAVSDAFSDVLWGALPTHVVPANAPKATDTLAVVDRFGNTAPNSGVRILVSSSSELTINGKAGSSAGVVVRTGADGTAEVTIVGREYAGTSYLLAITGATYDVDGDGDADDLDFDGIDDGEIVPGDTVDYTPADQIVLAIQSTVAASVTVAVLYNDSSVNSRIAGTDFDVVITVKDPYGRKLAGLGDFISLGGVDKVFDVDLDATEAGDVDSDDDVLASLFDNGDGTYSTTLRAVKAGRHSISATVSAAASPVSGSKTLTVIADKNEAQLTASIAEAEWSDDDGAFVVEVVTNKATALTLQLSDRFSNAVVLSANQTVVFDVVGAAPPADDDLSIRGTADGAEIPDLTLRSTKKFYVVAREEGDFTLSFDIGGSVIIRSAK